MEPEKIAKPLMKLTGRGITKLNGVGMYTEMNRNVLLLGVSPKEIHKVKRLLKDIDPEAFVILLTANELIGGRFSGSRYHLW